MILLKFPYRKTCKTAFAKRGQNREATQTKTWGHLRCPFEQLWPNFLHSYEIIWDYIIEKLWQQRNTGSSKYKFDELLMNYVSAKEAHDAQFYVSDRSENKKHKEEETQSIVFKWWAKRHKMELIVFFS